MGVRRFHVRVDLCNRRALSGGRRAEGIDAARIFDSSLRLLLHRA